VSRLDLVFDIYFTYILKAPARKIRGSGQKILVRPTTCVPKQFNSFLSVDENKEQLFHLLADCLAQIEPHEKSIICA